MTVKKKMIFVAAPPASGKTYVSERLGGGRRPAGAGPTWALCAGSGPRSGGGRAAPERTRAGAFAPAQVGTRSAQKGPGSREAEAGANSPRDPGPGPHTFCAKERSDGSKRSGGYPSIFCEDAGALLRIPGEARVLVRAVFRAALDCPRPGERNATVWLLIGKLLRGAGDQAAQNAARVYSSQFARHGVDYAAQIGGKCVMWQRWGEAPMCVVPLVSFSLGGTLGGLPPRLGVRGRAAPLYPRVA